MNFMIQTMRFILIYYNFKLSILIPKVSMQFFQVWKEHFFFYNPEFYNIKYNR
jgi:hypothetical protein